MSGNPDKASIWGDADVYIGDLTAPNPATELDPFGAAWGLIGLLDGDAGFEESRSRDSTDFFAWGSLLIRTSRKNFVLTRKFVALEDNPIVRKLVWPGSGPNTRVVPKANYRFKIAFDTFDGDKRKRVISRRFAEVEEIGTIKDSESELTKYEITVKIYPDSSGVLFDVFPTDDAPTLVSLAVTPATKALTTGADKFAKLTATATYSDGSTRDVTASSVWTSATPAKATVDRGYVAPVAAGTANVTAAFAGMSSTCAVTVS